MQCSHCDKQFGRSDSRLRHEQAVHTDGNSHTCDICGRQYGRKDYLSKHRKRKHHSLLHANTSGSNNERSGAKEQGNAKDNNLSCEGTSKRRKVWRPWEEGSVDDVRKTSVPTEPNLEEETADSDSEDARQAPDLTSLLEKIIVKNQDRIKTRRMLSNRLQDRFNFQTCNPTSADIASFLREIYGSQKTSFKLNASFGFILRHLQTDQLVYYYASNNNKLLDNPITVRNEADLTTFQDLFLSQDLLLYCRTQRPNTKFVVESITNVLFYVDKLKRFPIGATVELPDYIKHNRGIIGLERNRYGVRYADNMCLFRCLAIHRGANEQDLEAAASQLLIQWQTSMLQQQTGFQGVSIAELPAFEDCFNVNVEVFELRQDTDTADEVECAESSNGVANEALYVLKLFGSRMCHGESLNVNVYQNHFSYIQSLQLYSKRWGCRKCDKLFSYHSKLAIHERVCVEKTKLKFKGGGYGRKITIFDALRDADIDVPDSLTFYPYITAIAFEAMVVSIAEDRIVPKGLTKQLKPVSVSICSNVPGHTEPRCIIKEAENLSICQELVEYLIRISDSAYDLMLSKFQPVVQKLSSIIGSWRRKADTDLDMSNKAEFEHQVKQYEELSRNLHRWLRQTVVLGFNSGKFDLNLIRLEKLEETELPPRDAFWSNLKQEGISEVDYAWLSDVWQEQGFTSMRQFLVWYNNLDVVPFVEAAQKMLENWRGLGIDAFKGGSISIPGLALTHLMNTLQPHVILPVMPERFKDLHHLIRKNVVGGLSVVMHRYHETDVTKLPNGKYVKMIDSRDTNALYLVSLADEMGTGVFAVWRPSIDSAKSILSTKNFDTEDKLEWEEQRARNLDTVFSKEMAYTFSLKELQWLEWMSRTLNKPIRHQFSGGQKVFHRSPKISYPVDGYISDTKTVLQFHGCYWHGHNCRMGKGQASDRQRQTEEISRYLQSIGMQLIEIWECEWDAQVKSNPGIQAFLDEHVNLPQSKPILSGHEIIARIKKKQLFGYVECDIEVPRFRTDLIEKFKDYPPIFKNVEISRDDVGPFMKQYARENDFLKSPRRCLINSYFGHKILLSTSLIEWYLDNGLEITRIYQVIQMKPKKCFQHLCNQVAEKRRDADASGKKIVGEMWKNVGNNFYGKTYTNKMSHKNVSIASDHDAANMINCARFSEMEEVGNHAYEVKLDKKVINLDLPIAVAAFVYMNSKLRMLQFVYNLLHYYLQPGSYQLVCSDTDSIIAAYADRNIDNLVRPDRMQEYLTTGKPKYLVTDAHSLRTPGLFKIEWQGDGIIALCSKTYYFWDHEGQAKVSCKGLSKHTNKFTREDFKRVLETGRCGKGTNHGFKVSGQNIFQYEQDRFGLSYLYIKREVGNDGVSTKPLDL